MKSLFVFKKVICFTFVFVYFFICNPTVFAAEKVWPYKDESDIVVDNQYEYCFYEPGGVHVNGKMDDVISQYYSNGIYAFMYDSKNNNLYFIASNGDKWQIVNSTVDYTWDRSGLNQKISFGSDIKDYLVQDGVLSCKELMFLDKSHDLKIGIDTKGLGLPLYEDSTLKVAGIHKGKNKVSDAMACSTYLTSLNMISAKYSNEYESYLSPMKELGSKNANEIVDDSDAAAMQEAWANLKSWQGSLLTDLDNLHLTTASDDSNGFSVSNCENGLADKYQDLQRVLKRILETGKGYFDSFHESVSQAVASGRSELEDDLQQLSEQKTEIENSISDTNQYFDEMNMGTNLSDTSCQGLLGPDLLNDLSTVLTWIRIAVPILLIILGSVDFIKPLLSDDQQELQKSTGRFIKRCVIAVAIFFVPTIIMLILSSVDTLFDSACDIRLW